MTYTQRAVTLIVSLALVATPALVSSAEFKTGDQPSLSSGETALGNLYMAGSSVTNAGTVKGDLVVAGGSLLLSGQVVGDVFATGGNISILGEVGGDVRAAGGNVIVQGPVRGDVVAAGGQVNIEGSRVGGDIAIGGGSVRIDAPISGNVKIGGGQITINAPITGNVEIQAERLTLGSHAAIGGVLTYTATNEMTKESGATVRGAVHFTKRADIREAAKTGIVALASLWVVSRFLMLLIGAFLLAFIFTRYSFELVHDATAQPLIEIVRGTVFAIVTPIASVVLLLTIVGIPFGVIGLLACTAALILATLATPIIVGSIAHRWIFRPAAYVISWKTVLLGVVIFSLLWYLPLVGALIKSALVLLTLGAMLKIKWGIAKEWR